MGADGSGVTDGACGRIMRGFLFSRMSTPPRERAVTPELRAAVDFGRTSDDYARYRPGPPEEFYERLERLIPLKGMRVADLGAGTGVVGLQLARRGAEVVAIDPAAAQLAQASRLAGEMGVSLRTIVTKAEQTTLESASIDLAIVSQAWHWFDPVLAGAEIMRILQPGGMVMTVAFDYLPGRSAAAKRTEELILKYNPAWPLAGGNGCHIRPLFDLPAAGFTAPEQFSFEHEQVFTHEAWRGRMRTCNGVGASLPAEQVRAFDADLAAMLRAEFPDPMTITHRVWVVWGRGGRSAEC